MAAALSLFTGWAVGAVNGYKYNEGGLSNSIKYGTMGLVGGTHIINIFRNQSIKPATPGQFLAAILIGPPLVSGSVFCLGHHLGKAVGYAEESENKKNHVSIKLL
jgi:hypothetical protein